MTLHKKILVTLALCGAVLTNCRPPQTTAGADPGVEASSFAAAWPGIKKESRPWTRWWWMGSAVDDKNIGRQLQAYARAGLGGVEIAPIYGAIGHEGRYLEFLSPAWMNMLEATVQQAQDLNMGVDMTQGTGWPFGGPQVKPEYAAAKLFIQTYALKGGETLPDLLVLADPKQKEMGATLQALTAYGAGGEILDLTDKVDAAGKLNWRPRTGEWQLYAAFCGRTRQMVKRAAPGGVGLTLNHLSSTALKAYLSRFDQAFGNTNHGVRAFYNDSYEVYGADWSPEFLAEFQKRRGYDLRPYLRELAGKENSELVARLKADYRETMSQMVLENFTQPWTNWAHQRSSVTKNQAHGSPGNLLDLYAAVDIPECETFGSSYFPIPGLRRDSADIRNVDPDPIMLKFASSGGHASGHNLVSSETFTWLGEHFKTAFSQCKPEIEQVFLSGVNHVFFHGVTYSPEDVPWPGWLFYASLNLTPANSLWPHFRGLNDYIARTQAVLQAGQPDNELAVYWPVYDLWNQPQGREKLITVHAIDEWLHPTPFYKQVKSLMAAGYSLDFVSDKMLGEARVTEGRIRTAPQAAPHQVLLIPQTKYMPVATLEHILQLARTGATVVFERLPEDVPGLHDLEPRRRQLRQLLQGLNLPEAGKGIRQVGIGSGQVVVAADVAAALAARNVHPETLSQGGLKFIRRGIPGGKYYYLVNHTARAIDTQLSLNMTAASVVILDPQSGRAGVAPARAGQGTTQVRVQLKAGEALILKAGATPAAGLPAWQYLDQPAPATVLTGPWSLHFSQGGPELPADRKLNQLVSWTELADKKAEAFSGSGEYTATFQVPKKKAGEYILDLGKVSESARVWINGQEVGILWSIPFQARVGQYLKPGKNTLKVEVANLMANRIRYMDQQKIEWRRYHEINFVNINYKPFDASVWKPMPSGLLGPVTLTAYP
jgi:hypothetical protein